MTDQLDLTSYLQDQADDGTKDSEGDFTISHQNARRKLAKFSLPRETAWVSKLVQAAVAWKIAKIQVAQTKTETQFFFHTDNPGELPTEHQIVETLLSGNVQADSAIEHLCVALRSLVEQAGKSFILAINDGDLKPKPIYAGEHYGELSEGERLSQRYDRGMGMTVTVRHAPPTSLNSKLVDILEPKGGIPILLELRTCTYTSPVPIDFSGFRLDGILGSPLFDSGCVPLYLSGLKELENSPPQLRLPQKFEEKRLSYLTHPRRARRTYGGERRFAAAFALTARPAGNMGPKRRRCNINWVRDGVLVQSNAFDLETSTLGLTIYANAEGLQSDLTGFQLVETDEKRLREQEILDKLVPILDECRNETIAFFDKDTDEKSGDDEQIDKNESFRTKAKTVLGGTVAGLTLGLVNPPLGILTAAGTIVKTFLGGSLATNYEKTVLRNRVAIADAMRSDFNRMTERLKHRVGVLDKNFTIGKSRMKFDITDEDSVKEFVAKNIHDPDALVQQLQSFRRDDLEVHQAKYDALLDRAYQMMDHPN